MPIAEKRLKQISLQLESPVVVIGDASYSMDVAIRTATVISSVLTALCGAELKFFTGESVNPPVVPRSVADVLDVATGVKADGLTAPAAALWPYYTAKKIVKFFIVVTDEIENEKYKNYFFPTLFQKYYTEVYPAKIVFVSFLENPSIKGRMVTSLENMGIVPLQFKLDGKRPDLTKLDSLLGLLASESSLFPKQAKTLSESVRTKSLTDAIETISNPNVNTNSSMSSKEEMRDEVDSTKEKMKTLEIGELKENANLKGENSEAKEKESEKLCVICEENSCTTALLDCGHMNFCSTCAAPLKECPICRQVVVRMVRIYQT